MKTSLRILREHWGEFLLLFGAGLVSAAVTTAALPFLIRYLIDDGVLGGSVEVLIRASLVSFVVVLAGSLISYLVNLRRTRLAHRVLRSLNLGMLGRFYRMPLRQVRGQDNGYFVSRIHDETGRAVLPVVDFFSTTTITVLALIGAFAVLLSMSWRMTLVVAATAPLFVWLTHRTGPVMRTLSVEVAEREAQTKGLLRRLVAAHPVVNVFGLQAASSRQFDQGLQGQLETAYDNSKVAQRFTSLTGAMAFTTQLILLGASGYEILQGRLTFGGALAISNIYGILLGRANTLLQTVPGFQEARAILERLESFGGRGDELAGAEADRSSEGDVSLERVGFGYDPERPLYRDFDLEAKSGERLLLRGANGSGKSTLALLLTGLLEHDFGHVRTLQLERISMAFFPPVFVPGSLRDNVGYDRLDEGRRELYGRLIREMDLEGREEEDPENFSSGQKQKVAILMALLKEADLYVFDEPLANVDLASQGMLLETIFEATRGKTLVMAMHCESEVASRFDRCVDLDRVPGDTPALRAAG